MKLFDHTIRDPNGMHVRPTMALQGMLMYTRSKVKVMKGNKTANALDIMQIIDLHVLQGDRVTVSIEGPDEDTVSTDVEMYFENNF